MRLPMLQLRRMAIAPVAHCLTIAARLQVYRPLEFLFSVAAFTTLAENFLPQLISLPKVRGSPPVSLDPTK